MKSFKIFLFLAANCAMLFAQQTPAKPDPLAALRSLAGEWRGTSAGQPGNGAVQRTFAFVLNDRFFQISNTSVYPPQQKNKSGEKHEDHGMISYDRQRRRLIYRQFHGEGFVNTYVQQDSTTPNTLVFASEAIENISPGWRAKETWTILAPNEFIERFELAEPGKDFEVYVETHLMRVK